MIVNPCIEIDVRNLHVPENFIIFYYKIIQTAR
jgi:hypothetical protein